MDMDSRVDFDAGPLTWVKGEIDNALNAALTALAAWNGDDVTPLKGIAAYIHQVTGALQIVDLRGVSRVCETIEGLLADLREKPELRTPQSAEAIARSVRALQAYLDGLLEGAPNTELALTPVYAALLACRGLDPPAPGELFFPDISIRVRRPFPEADPDAQSRGRALRAARARYQKGLLLALRQEDAHAGLEQMSAGVADLERLAEGSAQYTFWWVVTGVLEAVDRGGLALDSGIKRLFGRLDVQMRRLAEGSGQLAERLFRDVLYHIAQDAAPAGRSAEVRALFKLDHYLPPSPDASARDPGDAARFAALREAVASAKDAWLRFCSGRQDSLEALRSAVNQMRTAIDPLPGSPASGLVAVVERALGGIASAAQVAQNEALQLEVATALLLLQHAADHHAALGADFAAHADLQGRRVLAALQEEADIALFSGAPLLDEIARQAQEKLLLAQVTHEIADNLKRVEAILDKFFRNRAERAALPQVPGLMKQIQGALNILQLDMASELVATTIERVTELSQPGGEIADSQLNWIAEAISSFGLYLDALRNGRDDPSLLSSLLARREVVEEVAVSVEEGLRQATDRLRAGVDQLADPERESVALATMRTELTRVARDAELVGDRQLGQQAAAAMALIESGARADVVRQAILGLAGAPAEAVVPAAEPGRLAAASAGEIDRELLLIFIDEAKEVLAGMDQQCAHLGSSLADHDAFAAVRRGFHTLKGSGRMVGLNAPAEVAWEVEQTLNLWLRDERTPTPELIAFLVAASTAFSGWVGELEALGTARVEAADLVSRARALRGEPAAEVATAANAPSEPAPAEAELVWIGEHSLSRQLFDIFADEAAELLAKLRALLVDLAQTADIRDWNEFTRAAHTLAGIARTTGLTPLADAARSLENWAIAWPSKTQPVQEPVASALSEVTRTLEGMFQATLGRRFPLPAPEIGQQLAALLPAVAEPVAAADQRATEPTAGPTGMAGEEHDPQLLGIFLAEADELLPRIGESLRAWRGEPGNRNARLALQRTLHTLKGSARMAGAMALGERTHQFETLLIEHGDLAPDAAFLDSLEQQYDTLAELVDHLRQPPGGVEAAPATLSLPAVTVPLPVAEEDSALRQAFRAKSNILDTLINEAGEVSIARARVEATLQGYKLTAQELTANVERLHSQLREMELQAETQMHSRLSHVDESQFDPLEFDRFTRLQELTRLMAESVSDVSTAKENLVAGLTEIESALQQQSRTTRFLQQELMHIRMVRLNSQAERLHRIVRQAAKELGVKARLAIEGGETELDRTVLERAIAPLEHLLRNAVVHGIEPPDERLAAAKPEYGDVRLVAKQEGSEVVMTLSDDGGGIVLDKISRRAEALGLLRPGEPASRERLEAFLFQPGFSTASAVTELAGRGVGLDVVRSEISSIGGRIRLESEPGQGTRFTIRLPATLALTQVVLVRAGDQTYALPASMVAFVREVRDEDWASMVASGQAELDGRAYPLRSLAELTGQQPKPVEERFQTVLLLRSGDERVALRVDTLLGNAEAMVKNIGPQLSRVPGVAGATVLGDGRVALILNPFVLMELAPGSATAVVDQSHPEARAPLVLVVDDSLTVRKITGRLLQREGYRVATAKDGLEAMEFLHDELPAIILLDIEMPRMDGFEVTRLVRADPRTRHVPIIMITSRTADKHRGHALDLGVNLYLGKPYREEELLDEITRLTHPT